MERYLHERSQQLVPKDNPSEEGHPHGSSPPTTVDSMGGVECIMCVPVGSPVDVVILRPLGPALRVFHHNKQKDAPLAPVVGLDL